MVPVTEMDPVLVKKALMDLVVVLKTVKEVVMTIHLYAHHVRKDIMETPVMTDVQITVRMAVLRTKEYVKSVQKDTGEMCVISVRNILIHFRLSIQIGLYKNKCLNGKPCGRGKIQCKHQFQHKHYSFNIEVQM